jgi:pimeloyl-ACP methyl ester carboxylesterase
MDSRAHGKSGGDMATYGWIERYDTVAITDALCSTEKVRHIYALGVSMGAAIALQSAATDPRIESVVAEDPFANLREVSYDYAGLRLCPFLGKTLFRPASMMAMRTIEKEGGFKPDDVSPEKAVASRAFPVLLICGTRDHAIPCRHAKRIYKSALGPKALWIVDGAQHASALGHSPAEYERRVIPFFENPQVSTVPIGAKGSGLRMGSLVSESCGSALTAASFVLDGQHGNVVRLWRTLCETFHPFADRIAQILGALTLEFLKDAP